MKTYYTIYQVTNKVNGKIYIGSHKTNNLDDGYMGSGKYLRYAQEKHGIENFHKEILFVFDNPDEMYAKEAELVDIEFIADSNTYNLKVGGFGGWDYVNSDVFDNPTHSLVHLRKMSSIGKEARQKRLQELFSDEIWSKKFGVKSSKLQLEQYKNGRINGFKGKTHTEETKVTLSEKAKARLADPLKNSQYGSMWIYSVEEQRNMKIKRGDPIPEGWLPGRKMKF